MPAAAIAGAALAIANAIVDVERDEEAGNRSVATALGRGRASVLIVVLHGMVAALAIIVVLVLQAPPGWVAAVVAAAALVLGGALAGVAAAGRSGTAWRERAWEVQAVGTGLLAIAWLGAVSASMATPRGG